MEHTTEADCEHRREDLYKKVNALKERLDKMQGGISVAKWLIGLLLPLMLLLLGAFVKLQTDSLKQQLEHMQMMHEKPLTTRG